MSDLTRRPFYGEFAWAYNLLITPSVSAQCDFIAEMLYRRGVVPPGRILDAGCGTGSYAVELARLGYVVAGLDASAPLVEEAERRARDAALPVSFAVGDILDMPAHARFDGVLCRGVLNDFLDDESRREVFFSFARALRARGVLVLDVREWDETVARKTREPVFEKTVETPRGNMTFRSVTRLEHQTRRLLVSERHTLLKDGVTTVSDYDFQMRCWTREELRRHLLTAGFEAIELFGAYDLASPAGASDRLVCVAARE